MYNLSTHASQITAGVHDGSARSGLGWFPPCGGVGIVQAERV